MKDLDTANREIDDLWLLLRLRHGSGAMGSSPFMLVGNFVGGEGTITSATYVPVALFTPSLFLTTVGGQKLYIAAYISEASGASFDLYDLTAAASVLAAPCAFTNSSPAVIVSEAITTPLVTTHAYELRALVSPGGDSPAALIQSAWIL